MAKKFEEIFVPNKKEPITLPQNSPLLRIFQRVRDEAHRFAIKLHKTQREKRVTGSILDDIKVTRNKLLDEFGDIKGIKSASFEQLVQVVGEKLAVLISERLDKE